jgi:hypothetical protein
MVFKSRKMRQVGHVEHMGEMGNAYKMLVSKPEGKRPHRRPTCRWEGSITMDLRELGLEGVD